MLTYDLQLLFLSTYILWQTWFKMEVSFFFAGWNWQICYVSWHSQLRTAHSLLLVSCVCVVWCAMVRHVPPKLFVHQSDWVSNMCSAFQLPWMQWLYSHLLSLSSSFDGWCLLWREWLKGLFPLPLNMILLRTRFGLFGKNSSTTAWFCNAYSYLRLYTSILIL